MSRYQAFGIHLGISLTIFGVLAYIVVKIWYPDFFFYTDGGWQGLRLLLGVDLVLGPLLTLIVYRAGKPGLRFDLTMIGMVQAACLAAGIWIVHDARPLAIVYVDGSFYSVSAQSFRDVDVPIPNLDSFAGASPKWLKVQLPTDPAQQSSIRGSMLRSNRMLATVSDYYAPFTNTDIDPKEARSIDQIIKDDKGSDALKDWLSKYSKPSKFKYYLFGARYTYGYLAFDSTNHRLIGFLNSLVPQS